MRDLCVFRHHLRQAADRFFHAADRVTFVISVIGVQKLSVLGQQCHLGCCGTAVYTQETVAMILFDISGRCLITALSLTECFQIRFRFKQTLQMLQFHAGTDMCQIFLDLSKRYRTAALAVDRRTMCCKQMSVLRHDLLIRSQMQGICKTFTESRQEMQRSAQKCHFSLDTTAACQTGNGLIHHRLKDTDRQILSCYTIVNERLDIRLCKYAAASCDRILCMCILCQQIQSGCIRLDQGCHLIDKRTGTTGTDTIHTLFHTAGQIHQLCIFSAQLNDHIRLRVQLSYRTYHRNNFLHKRDLQTLCQLQAAASGNLYGTLGISDGIHQFSQ